MDGDADRACLVGERASYRLAYPPSGVRRELESSAVVEFLGGSHQADCALLDEVEEGQAPVAIALGNRDDQPEVGANHVLSRLVVAALDLLRKFDLLGGREEIDLGDVPEEELKRVNPGTCVGRGRHAERSAVGRIPELDLLFV